MTLLELVIACAILVILSTVALPMARVEIVHGREAQLHERLLEVREAIDRYKSDADGGLIKVDAGGSHYPPDLAVLTTGVQLTSSPDKRVHYLKDIPTDPIEQTEFGKRSTQDDPDSHSWGGQDVFDVYSTSNATALDGTKYKDW